VLARPRMVRGEDEVHYLMRALRNTFYTSRRTASRRPVTGAALEDVVAADPRPTSRPERAIEVQELYATIAQLPEDFRLALVAVDVLGLSYREAARALKVREATITTRLFRARKQVAKRLADDPEAEAEARTSGSAAPEPPASARPGREQIERSGVLPSRDPT
jgi:RNA polymerase sigma-70 factor, ECF subfamily